MRKQRRHLHCAAARRATSSAKEERMQRLPDLALTALLMVSAHAAAQNFAGTGSAWLDTRIAAATTGADANASAMAPVSQPAPAADAASGRLIPWMDYGGDLAHRPALTGNWGGSRQKLINDGVRLNLYWTQTLQGNVAGGISKRLFYQGGMRYEAELDTAAAGLWPGGMLHVRGETQYGQTNFFDSGALLPVNTDGLYPVPDADLTCLSEAYYVQYLAPWIGAVVGKISPRDRNVFAHDETTQFLNGAFNYDPVYGTTVPLDFLGAGLLLEPTDWLNVTTLILDSEGTASRSGFDTAFERGTSVFQMLEFAVDPLERPGHQRLMWTWSDKIRPPVSRLTDTEIRELILRRIGLVPGPAIAPQTSDWSILYDFDQYLHIKEGTGDQGFGLFGRFGVGDDNVNPVAVFYSLGAGGKGVLPGRDADTFGVGYYYLTLSNEISPAAMRALGDEQGVEIWYNIALSPWLHLMPDVQVIDPGRNVSTTAVVLGLRMRIDF
jgi:porin